MLSIKFLKQNLSATFEILKYYDLIKSSDFKSLVGKDLENIRTTQEGNNFFVEHAGFIQGCHQIGRSGLGFFIWQKFLHVVSESKPELFKQIHKGTAYYHAGIFAIKDIRIMEGLEFIEYAITEDIKLGANQTPAGFLMALDPLHRGNDQGVQDEIMKAFSLIIKRYNQDYGRQLSLEQISIIVKSYFLEKGVGARRAAWCNFIGIVNSIGHLIDSFKISPEAGEAQTSAKLILVRLCLSLETIMKNIPDTSGHDIQDSDTLGDLLTKKLNYTREERKNIQELYLGLKGHKGDFSKFGRVISDSLISEREKDLALAWIIRNNANHVFSNFFIDGRVFGQIATRISSAVLGVIDEYYHIEG
jgi:hypothetical protein